jgi:hypothetical protein
MRPLTVRPVPMTLAAALSAGILAVGAVAVPAAAVPVAASGSAADAQVVAADDAEAENRELLRQRLAVACARIPNVVSRSENLQERLAGDASTRGSLAWLEDRAKEAEDLGRTELAQALRTRLEVRTELAELLPLRLEALADAEVACGEAGL